MVQQVCIFLPAPRGRTYGDPNPDFGGSLSGVKNNDAISVTYSTVATQTTGVGKFAIIPHLQGTASVFANYQSPVIVNGTLSITPAPLTAKANASLKIRV